MRRYAITFLFTSAVLLALHRGTSAQKIRVAAPAILQPAGAPAVTEGKSPEEEDAQILKNAKVGGDGKALLDYFRKRLSLDTDPKRIQKLIEDLDDDDFEVREKASSGLVELGVRALIPLRQAEADKENVEVSRRAEKCRILIEGEAGAAVSAAAARQVARKKVGGAAEVLLKYLPFAEDDNVAEEIRNALVVVGVDKGKPGDIILKALEDKQKEKRAAAAEVLCRANVKDQFPAVRKLLKDKEAIVRLRAALGLIPHKETAAVPILIETFKHLDEKDAWQGENLLFDLAGEDAPTVALGDTAESRTKCAEEWAAWWKKNGAKVDLAKVGKPAVLLGYTIICQMDRFWKGGRQQGKVYELDANKKVRWTIDNLNYPVDAQMIGKDKVLICEYQGRQVTVRDLKGKVEWTKGVNGWPIGAERLRNGNTFIVMQNELLEVDKDGKEVWKYQRFNHDITRAKKLRNGDVAFITNQGLFVRMNKDKKELKTFNVGGWFNVFGGLEVLPNGRVLVPNNQFSKVSEYTQDGKIVWEAKNLQFPTSAHRLPNGQTIVSSQNNSKIIVLDRKGKEVWSHTADGMVYMARRR
jgi:HEAT repeat protein